MLSFGMYGCMCDILLKAVFDYRRTLYAFWLCLGDCMIIVLTVSKYTA